jgi:hypothetical protein
MIHPTLGARVGPPESEFDRLAYEGWTNSSKSTSKIALAAFSLATTKAALNPGGSSSESPRGRREC